MKKLYTLLLLSFTAVGFSQAPANYYNSATGTGYTLKTQLKAIITAGHIDRGYAGLWTTYATSDRDMGIGYENDNTIVDIYSENPVGTDPYNFIYDINQCGTYTNEGDCYNREHLVPQSYFEDVTTDYTRTDAHHIVPTDGKVNNYRNNYAFGKVNTATYTSQNGSKLGPLLNSGYSAGAGTPVVFEPIDEFKGDVARCFLYFATRYEDQMDEFYASKTLAQVPAKAMFDGSINKVFSSTFLNILLTWNQQDPVSAKEMKRNNAIYTRQGNRNPYIDNNAYVTAIWGLPALSTQTFDALANVSVYPNPANNHRINIETEQILNEIQLININGQLMQEIKNPNAQNNTYTLENLPSGFYFLKLASENQSTVKKIIVN
ncbi:endonuclease [uncultured Flavobacterium sp.]|uniref:endonuclease n=1 Tax=uncultured Flavobacterium sp. TaxID=165435 RepID=UPI0025D68A3A|nr:endonuclease [uncultured Flavobacterium sp.]